MKTILIGYPESQKILNATKYLIDKYCNDTFDFEFLNYEGEIDGWSKYLADYLSKLTDQYVIVALDDYFMTGPVDMTAYQTALEMIEDSGCKNVKLCECTDDEQAEYPVTTQYTLWDRKYLIELLQKTTSPWDFEMSGSYIFKQEGHTAGKVKVFSYNVLSALSKRWHGVSLKGLNYDDVLAVKQRI